MKFSVSGDQFSMDDLTLGETVALEKELGVPWGLIDPVKIAEHAVAVLCRFAQRGGLSVDDAKAWAEGLTQAEYVGLVSVEDDVPKDEALTLVDHPPVATTT